MAYPDTFKQWGRSVFGILASVGICDMIGQGLTGGELRIIHSILQVFFPR